jgi:cytochrome P450
MLDDWSTAGLLTVLFVIATSYVALKRRRKCSIKHHLPDPPALPSLPILGSLPFLSGKDPAAFLLQKSKELDKVFSLYAASRYVVVLNSRDVIHEALVTRGNDFADRPTIHVQHISNPDSNGLIFSHFTDGYKHCKQLTVGIFKMFGYGKRIMETRIMIEVESLIRYIRSLQGKPFNPAEIVESSVSNITLNILYGRRYDHKDPAFRQLLSDMNTFVRKLFIELDIFPILRLLPSYRSEIRETVAANIRILEFIEHNVTACQQDEMNESFVRSFVDAEGSTLDRKNLNFVLRDLTVAGTDTSSMSILWFFVIMANHRSVQDRLHAEIDSVVGRDRLPGLDDRKSLPYLEATITELMRYRTLLPLALHATLNDTEVNGCFIPAKAMVVVNLHSYHMDPDAWQQPDQFRPERFLDDSDFPMDQEKIIPFSLGKRACLGQQLARQELFLFNAALLQHFDICPPEGQEHIDDTWKFASVVSPAPFTVRLVSRY